MKKWDSDARFVNFNTQFPIPNFLLRAAKSFDNKREIY